MATEVVVKAGHVVTYPNGQALEVTEYSAVGGGDGTLYATQSWFDSVAANRAAWEGRGWIRKTLGMAPEGYWETHQRAGSLFGVVGEMLGI